LSAAKDKGPVGSPAWSGMPNKPAQETLTAINRKTTFALRRLIQMLPRRNVTVTKEPCP
jgi:hypothetical protein